MLHRPESRHRRRESLSAGIPASRAQHTAASTFSTLCAPFSGISATGITGSGLAPSFGCHSTLSPCTNAPCLIGRRGAEPEDLRLALAQRTAFTATICVGASSPFSTRKSPAPCRSVIRAFAAAYASKRPMPIQVVRRDIQHHRNPRMKLLHRLQLKAREPPAPFHAVSGRMLSLRTQLDHRRPDIPAHQRRQPRIRKDLAHQRSRRRLPVRPRNRHDLRPAETGSPAPARQ